LGYHGIYNLGSGLPAYLQGGDQGKLKAKADALSPGPQREAVILQGFFKAHFREYTKVNEIL
jgi:hypothetical protein